MPFLSSLAESLAPVYKDCVALEAKATAELFKLTEVATESQLASLAYQAKETVYYYQRDYTPFRRNLLCGNYPIDQYPTLSSLTGTWWGFNSEKSFRAINVVARLFESGKITSSMLNALRESFTNQLIAREVEASAALIKIVKQDELSDEEFADGLISIANGSSPVIDFYDLVKLTKPDDRAEALDLVREKDRIALLKPLTTILICMGKISDWNWLSKVGPKYGSARKKKPSSNPAAEINAIVDDAPVNRGVSLETWLGVGQPVPTQGIAPIRNETNWLFTPNITPTAS